MSKKSGRGGSVELPTDGSILASEVRYQAGVIVGDGFGKYKKFEKLSKRMKVFLNLKAVKMSAQDRAMKWISKN